jgi:hypothetical protein
LIGIRPPSGRDRDGYNVTYMRKFNLTRPVFFAHATEGWRLKMRPRRLSRFPITCAVLFATLLAPAWAGEPSARDLAGLVPVIDSSNEVCRSIEIGGFIGDEKGPGPRMRFRALYRAPDRFSFLLSDSADGTPLVFCSGRKILVYDPVGPSVVYSEDGGFRVEMTGAREKIKFNYICLFKNSNKISSIFMDLNSLMAYDGKATGAGAAGDSLAKIEGQKYALIKQSNDHTKIYFEMDLARRCPCTSVTFTMDGSTFLCLDKIVLDGPLDDEQFAFPAKELLARELPIRDVTADEDFAKIRDTAEIVGRAAIVRSVMYQVGSQAAINIPGLSGVDWERVREDDKKLSKALRELVPSSLQSGARKVGPQPPRKGWLSRWGRDHP